MYDKASLDLLKYQINDLPISASQKNTLLESLPYLKLQALKELNNILQGKIDISKLDNQQKTKLLNKYTESKKLLHHAFLQAKKATVQESEALEEKSNKIKTPIY